MAKRFGVGFALVIALATTRAAADESLDRAAAEAAFREGVALLEAGDLASACPKLEAAVALTKRDALGGLLQLGGCYEKSGRVASAWAIYSEVAGKARVKGQTEREAEAQAAASAIEARVPHVRIVLPPGGEALAGVELLRGTVTLPREAWSTALPVDPGAVTFTLRAVGHEEQVQTVTMAEGAIAEVRFAPLVPVPLPPVDPPRDQNLSPPLPDEGGLGGQEIAGLVVGGAGVVTAVIGFALAGVAASDHDEAMNDPANGCDQPPAPLVCDDTTAIDDARALGNVATALVIAGGVTAAAGGVVFLTAPDASETARLRLAPSRLILEGRF